MIIRELFACPIFQQKIDNYDLKDYVINLSKNKTVEKSNTGGWQSDLFFKPEIEFESLWKNIEFSLNKYHQSLQLTGSVYIDNWWFNINYKGHSNKPHNHSNSVHSGTFYINTPEKCGNIYFEHPCSAISWTYPDNIIGEENTINSKSWFLPAIKDWLYIFPSYITHWVEGNLSDEPRISLAFNTKVRK